MLFHSPEFIVLFTVAFVLYYLPWLRSLQLLVLIGASLVFYAWHNPVLLLLLVACTLTNAGVSFAVANAPAHRRRAWAAAGLAANLGVLAFFKYAGLFTRVALAMLHARQEGGVAQMLLQLPLPIGISFYTFEGISLLVDTFRAKGVAGETFLEARFGRHLPKTALFIVFFPHLIAGPILKAKQFYPQVGPKAFCDIPWEHAFRCLVLGYFLKMVVADNLKDWTFWLTYPYFTRLATATALSFLFGYSCQIFADFAGYSLIAIGLAALFGYELPANFSFPYLSRSLAEFWRRWHISLSTWLRDYLYFPLGGNRKGRLRTYLNLMAVMALGGLWHGAAWSYAVWGAYHGLGLAVERAFTQQRRHLAGTDPSAARWTASDALRAVAVFTFVTFGWVLFRLPDFGQAAAFVRMLPANLRRPPAPEGVLAVLVFCMPVVIYHLWNAPWAVAWHTRRRARNPSWWRLADCLVYGFLLAAIGVNSGSAKEFIYFQF